MGVMSKWEKTTRLVKRTGYLVKVTDNAFLAVLNGVSGVKHRHWFPKSICFYDPLDSNVLSTVVIYMPKWFASRRINKYYGG